jgi:hypothetical protein
MHRGIVFVFKTRVFSFFSLTKLEEKVDTFVTRAGKEEAIKTSLSLFSRKGPERTRRPGLIRASFAGVYFATIRRARLCVVSKLFHYKDRSKLYA